MKVGLSIHLFVSSEWKKWLSQSNFSRDSLTKHLLALSKSKISVSVSTGHNVIWHLWGIRHIIITYWFVVATFTRKIIRASARDHLGTPVWAVSSPPTEWVMTAWQRSFNIDLHHYRCWRGREEAGAAWEQPRIHIAELLFNAGRQHVVQKYWVIKSAVTQL